MKAKIPSAAWTRAALSKLAGTGLETLRFYEEKGLLGKPQRNASGYRIYGAEDLERLQFIQRAQDLGFSLQEIGELIRLTGDITTPRKKVRELAAERLEEIKRKLATLRAMERALGNLVKQCDGKGELQGCPIAEFVGGKNTQTKGGCHE
ncbi:MAG TPA: MerR family transcriptional regulator [Verrucomicrobiales bacterium]|nr:MerR family transcriptional regulator [Verrucomicrobiales bacterium]